MINVVVPKWSFMRRWIRQISDAFGGAVVSNVPQWDMRIRLFGWADDNTNRWIAEEKPGINVVFMRRYEYYLCDWSNLRKANLVVFVNDFIRGEVEKQIEGLNCLTLYNGVDLKKWTYRERDLGKNIAMVGKINYKKNLPLAVQIMHRLPGHTLHIAGELACKETLMYVKENARNLDIRLYGNVSNMDEWLEDKNILLNTSIAEGNPNAVIEAMAKGIKPVVHSWPGARYQFDTVFENVEEAVELINADYDSKEYRRTVEEKYNGETQYKRLKEAIDNECSNRAR